MASLHPILKRSHPTKNSVHVINQLFWGHRLIGLLGLQEQGFNVGLLRGINLGGALEVEWKLDTQGRENGKVVCFLFVNSPSGQWAQGLNNRDDKQPWPPARALTPCHQLKERAAK